MMRVAPFLLVIPLALGGCAKQDDVLTLALVPKAMNNPFFDLARDGCKDAADEIAGPSAVCPIRSGTTNRSHFCSNSGSTRSSRNGALKSRGISRRLLPKVNPPPTTESFATWRN